MQCLDVTINGKKLGLVGRIDAEALFAVVAAHQVPNHCDIELTAALPLRDGRATYASWGSHPFTLGDRIEISVVEAEDADPGTVVVHGQGAQDDAASAQWPLCSFCGRSLHEVHTMSSGRRAQICDSCIDELAALQRDARQGDSH